MGENSNEGTVMIVDSSGSSSDDEKDEEAVARAEELERHISDNKYLYDAHMELVGLYRKLGDLVSMRQAYERFHEVFPLTPEIWLAWIDVEKQLVTSDLEKQNIIQLFENAVEDYMSVDLWVEYAAFSIGVSDLQTTRSVLEKGLTNVGLHAEKGHLLWDTLRELELAHLSLADEGSDTWKEQIHKIVEVFRRQLSVPLMNMESTYEEWTKFRNNIPESLVINAEPIDWGYKKALKILKSYKPFEDKLLATDDEGELVQTYKEYIKTVSDPSTILCLYERAVAKMCLNINVWLDYCYYAINLGETADKISKKSLRNCPWSEELWIARLRIVERLFTSEEVMKAFEQGISSMGKSQGVELWLTYLETVRRTDNVDKLKKLFDQALKQNQYNDNASTGINRFYARFLAKNGDMPGARKIWKSIFKIPQNRQTATFWLEFINLERQYGEISQVRNLFQRAVSSCTDWLQYLAEEWLMFEREFGSSQDALKCTEKCMEISQKQQPKEASNQAPQQEKGKKRKLEDEVHPENKRSKPESTVRQTKKPPIVKDPATTVFVSNLHPGINDKKLKKFFPSAVEVEIVIDRKGVSRCFGFVQFALEEEVLHALARDRELLDNRPIFISNCKTDKTERKQAFKYSAQVEPNKLFVKGLPLDKKQEDVEDIFKPYGAINVRIVLKKNGQPKGLAYIEFPDEQKAKVALESTDQMKIGEHTLSVAISAPPPKGSADPPEPSRRARSRIQLPLIPRSLHVKGPASNGGGDSNKQAKSNDDFRKMLLNKM